MKTKTIHKGTYYLKESTNQFLKEEVKRRKANGLIASEARVIDDAVAVFSKLQAPSDVQ